jgi:hypothetical protein
MSFFWTSEIVFEPNPNQRAIDPVGTNIYDAVMSIRELDARFSQALIEWQWILRYFHKHKTAMKS